MNITRNETLILVKINLVNSTEFIIILSISGFIIFLCSYIVFILHIRRKQEEDFRKWLSQEANKRIPNIQPLNMTLPV